MKGKTGKTITAKGISKAALYLLVALIGVACTAPGSNLGSGSYQEESAWFEGGGGGVWFPGILNRGQEELPEDLANTVDIVPITPSLLVEQPMLTQPTLPNAVPAAAPVELSDELASYEYRVAPGDILNIIVYEHPELTIPAGSQRTAEESGIIVENDGTLFYPYVGIVNVEGLTVNQIRDIIADDLAEFINDPQVDVKVVVYNAKRVFVTGQVNNPGPQRITNVPLTILDAIANAGGLTENANWHEVLLSRNGVETELSVYEMLNNGRLGQNRLLQHGDVLHVPDVGLQEVYVLGELNEVNILPMGNIRMSLTEAVTMAQGLNQETSDAKGLFVIRPNAGEGGPVATLYQLNVQNAVSFALGSKFMLQPQDIVYVTTAPVSRWSRVITQIIPGNIVNVLLVLERLAD